MREELNQNETHKTDEMNLEVDAKDGVMHTEIFSSLTGRFLPESKLIGRR